MATQLTQNMKEMDPSTLPVRHLHKPSPLEVRQITNQLAQDTKSTLQNKAEPFLALMRKYRFTFNPNEQPVEEPPIVSTFRSSHNQLKSKWVDLLVLFYNPKNHVLIFDDMPKPQVDLWREVLRNHYVICDDVNKIMGTNCFKKDRWGCAYSHLTEPLCYYFTETRHQAEGDPGGYYRDWDTFIHSKISHQQELLKKFFPDLTTIDGRDSLPEESDFKRYNNEYIVFSKLPVLAMLYESDQLPHNLNKQTAAVVKRAQKALLLPDFFDYYPGSAQAPLSTSLLVNYYIFFREYTRQETLPDNPEQLIKHIFDKMFLANPCNAFTLSVLLPYLTGIKKSKLETYNYSHVIKALVDLLRKHYNKNWLSIDQLIMKLRMSDTSNEEHFLLVSPYYIDDMDLRNGFIKDKNPDCYIHPGNLVRQLSEPFVKAVLCVLATFGIAELAYREPQDGDTSPYDGLQYVHLTELGKYALGLTDNYEPQVANDNSSAFELDDRRLLIKVLHDSPFQQILADYADCITPTLYSVSYESFLRNCSTRFEVERKVKMFGQYIGEKQPQLWKDFLKDVAKRCNPFTMPKDHYILLTLPKDNIELQRLVLGNPSIRRYVLKVEGYKLLVKQNDLDNLSKAMKKFGYLI